MALYVSYTFVLLFGCLGFTMNHETKQRCKKCYGTTRLFSFSMPVFNYVFDVSDTKYKIAVYTGYQRGAGTDANVKIRLYYGIIASTASMTLNNPKKDDFETGS